MLTAMGGWRGRDEEVNVAKYVVLVNWTEKGVMEAKATGDRAKKFQDMAKSVGASVDTLLWCLGRYDIVSIVDAPDDATMALLGLKVASMGSVRSETLRAFTADEIGGIIGKL
jgi:uncharacterized protein with GYD domain